MSYDFVWFDLGYTLLRTDREALFRSVLSGFGVERGEDEIARAFHKVDKLFMREYPGVLGGPPETFMPWFIGVVCWELGAEIDLRALGDAWMEAWTGAEPLWTDYDAAKPALSALRGRGLGLGVISNWDCTARPILERCGLARFFDPIVISSEVGCSKPSEAIFRTALDAAKVEPRRCLYVGDNYYDDAVGAAKVGMDAVIVNRFGTFGVEELSGQRIVRDVSEVPAIACGEAG